VTTSLKSGSGAFAYDLLLQIWRTAKRIESEIAFIPNQLLLSAPAIEGRNGYLSRLHHSGRGLTDKDLQVLSIIHNYDLHRADGSTAAQRFFGRTFPPLFSWVLDQMGDLPASRKSRKFRNVNALVA